MEDLEAALETLSLKQLRRWAKRDGHTDLAADSAPARVKEILDRLRTGPNKPPGACGSWYVPELMELPTLVEEQLCAGMWSNASYQVTCADQ
jgi:hypothetical protein|eukprot:COSAG01_NODE_1632_length_9668_cov_100.223952_2_plen_92_part_00